MDILSQEGSMLLEEEIDENYEPTEEGFLEFVPFKKHIYFNRNHGIC